MDCNTSLYSEAALGHYGSVEHLLQTGDCDVNFVNSYKGGKTPLYIAASWGSINHLLTIEALLKHGADINLTNNCGQTPLYVAASWGHPLAVSLLIQHGANVNQANYEQRSPLHIASCPKPHIKDSDGYGCKYGVFENNSTHVLFQAAVTCMSKRLFNYKIYLENLENDYKSLLEYNRSCMRIPDKIMEKVLYYNYFGVAIALAEAGANVNAIDHRGQTPLDKAFTWGHPALIQYLGANGAVNGQNLCLSMFKE